MTNRLLFENSPVFSIIIPIHNAEATLTSALESLRSQIFQNWEAFLINDASTDGSLEIAKQACKNDPRMYLIDDPQQLAPRRAASTRNLGISKALGQYIAFLDSDDLWLPEKLARQHEAFQKGADIVFSSYRRMDAAGHDKGIVRANLHVVWKDALVGNPIGCSTGAYRRATFPQARMPLDTWPEDYCFWLGLLRGGTVAVGLPEVLAVYRVTADSVSSNKLASAHGVWLLLGKQNISLTRRIYSFLGYIMKSANRRCSRSLFS